MGTLPRSFYTDGFVEGLSALSRRKHPRTGRLLYGLMVGTDGLPDTGKTEFMLSAPGPGQVICLDRGFAGVVQNSKPPATRRKDFGFNVVTAPLATQAKQDVYVEYWKAFYARYKSALENPDSMTVGIDGDSDSWELQRLAEFGKLTQIPSIMYTNVNAARRAMYARAWDSGKIIIATNKVTPEYVEEKDEHGNVILGADGKPKRIRSGDSVRQGFADQDYLWAIQLRHLYKPPETLKVGSEVIVTSQQWGIRISRCKVDKSLEGLELWGDDCNFPTLVQTVYPDIPLEDWGY